MATLDSVVGQAAQLSIQQWELQQPSADLRREPASGEDSGRISQLQAEKESPVKHMELMLARELQRDNKSFFRPFRGMVVLERK